MDLGLKNRKSVTVLPSLLKNAFVICILPHIISILDIKFPHSNILIHAPCWQQNIFISYLYLKLFLNLEQSGCFVTMILPSTLPAPWEDGSVMVVVPMTQIPANPFQDPCSRLNPWLSSSLLSHCCLSPSTDKKILQKIAMGTRIK